jgi:hypothetical protein
MQEYALTEQEAIDSFKADFAEHNVELFDAEKTVSST